jgi:hypothetical protein
MGDPNGGISSPAIVIGSAPSIVYQRTMSSLAASIAASSGDNKHANYGNGSDDGNDSNDGSTPPSNNGALHRKPRSHSDQIADPSVAVAIATAAATGRPIIHEAMGPSVSSAAEGMRTILQSGCSAEVATWSTNDVIAWLRTVGMTPYGMI